MAFLYSHSLFIFNFLLISITSSNSSRFSENLIQSMTMTRMEKTTHHHFYFQDKLSSPHPTAVKIIGDGYSFGTTIMIDDALTQDPEPDSKIIGRAQGTYALAAQDDLALLMVETFSFTEGEYNGSSISMLGRNHVMDVVRKMPIVGGSGLFRLGRGYALAHTVWFDRSTGDASVEYNVILMHF
ncbi:hypothetical protein OROHE_005552 [Orobanche hederae]